MPAALGVKVHPDKALLHHYRYLRYDFDYEVLVIPTER
jgi:hypothetical protein